MNEAVNLMSDLIMADTPRTAENSCFVEQESSPCDEIANSRDTQLHSCYLRCIGGFQRMDFVRIKELHLRESARILLLMLIMVVSGSECCFLHLLTYILYVIGQYNKSVSIKVVFFTWMNLMDETSIYLAFSANSIDFECIYVRHFYKVYIRCYRIP